MTLLCVELRQNERLLEHGDQIKLDGSEVTLVFQQDAAGAIVVEAANTPPHGVYISRSLRRRTCPSWDAASEFQEAESALMTALATSK